jgi:hypothetical protein
MTESITKTRNQADLLSAASWGIALRVSRPGEASNDAKSRFPIDTAVGIKAALVMATHQRQQHPCALQGHQRIGELRAGQDGGLGTGVGRGRALMTPDIS